MSLFSFKSEASPLANQRTAVSLHSTNKWLTQRQICHLSNTVVIKTDRLTEDSHSSRLKHETFFSVSGFHDHTEGKWIQLVIDTVSFTESHFALITGSPVQHKMRLVKIPCASRHLPQSGFDSHPFLGILCVQQKQTTKPLLPLSTARDLV